MPGLSSGTFSDKPISYPRRAMHSMQRGAVQSFMWQSEGMKAFSIAKVSSVDWWHGEWHISPKPMAAMGQEVRIFCSSTPVCYVVCQVRLEPGCLTRLSEVFSLYGLYKVRSSCLLAPTDGGWCFCGLGQSGHTLRAFSLCACCHHCHSSHGIHLWSPKSPHFFILYIH